MAIQDEAGLVLKLYELRREETMRTARDWYTREFNPETMADVEATLFSQHSGHLRMVISYWDMAAALVNSGAIGLQLFNDTNGEQFLVFGKIEPFLKDIRANYGPQYAVNLEKAIDATPGGRERAGMMRERMKTIRAKFAAAQAKSAQG
jgi:hypothetical protein